MAGPLTVGALARPVWHDFRRSWAALVVYEALFKLLETWLFLPALAVALSAALLGAGHVAVSNRDVLAFLLSPLGLLYAALLSTVAVALLLLILLVLLCRDVAVAVGLRAFDIGMRLRRHHIERLRLLPVMPIIRLAQRCPRGMGLCTLSVIMRSRSHSKAPYAGD